MRKDTMERQTLAPAATTISHRTGSAVAPSKRRENSFDLLDELELLLQRKGRLPVFLVTFIALALCFLVVGLVMATGIMLVTFFLFIRHSDTASETGSLNPLGDM